MSESNVHPEITPELQRRNAEAYQVRLSEVNQKLAELEEENKVLRNHVQTCINQVQQLNQTVTLALAQVRGAGPTSR